MPPRRKSTTLRSNVWNHIREKDFAAFAKCRFDLSRIYLMLAPDLPPCLSFTNGGRRFVLVYETPVKCLKAFDCLTYTAKAKFDFSPAPLPVEMVGTEWPTWVHSIYGDKLAKVKKGE